jgi:hypothetical protein
VAGAGAVPLAHCCAADAPLDLLTGAGAAGISVDLAALALTQYDAVAGLLEAGRPVLLGVVPSTEPDTRPTDRDLTEQVLRFLDMTGVDPGEPGDALVVTPACGLAGATPAWAREALRLSRTVAGNVG